MDKLGTFTSTGQKLIHHPEVVYRIKEMRTAVPISLQVAPTSRCNLKCVFCSNANRDKHEDLDDAVLATTIRRLKDLGLKTVEITGGGDPTMYEPVNNILQYCHQLGLKIGMISNGLLVKERITSENLANLHWLRISMNCLDYADMVDIPEIGGTLGMSYVWNDKTTDDVLARLQEHVEKYQPAYVRMVPNCQATDEEQEQNNRELSVLVEKMNAPYFFQAKIFSQPPRCWWGYFKPFVLHNGWVYPCSSVVLNQGSDYTFHERYQWVRLEDLPGIYAKDMVPLPTEHCNHCVFRGQNDLVDGLINPNGMEDFV